MKLRQGSGKEGQGMALKAKGPEIIGMDIYYLNLRCMSKRVVSCYEGLNQVR